MQERTNPGWVSDRDRADFRAILGVFPPHKRVVAALGLVAVLLVLMAVVICFSVCAAVVLSAAVFWSLFETLKNRSSKLPEVR